MSSDDPVAWSAESAKHLQAATDELVSVLQGFTGEVGSMHGGSAEIPLLVRLRADVLAAATRWNERVAERSGYFVFPAGDFDPEMYGDLDAVDDPPEPRLPAQAEVSVLSRFDLAVVDVEALMGEARQAWRDRIRPEDDERDAAVAVDDVPAAVDLLLSLRGPEPYERFHVLPGVEVRAGMHLLVDPDEPLVGPSGEHPVQDLDHPERAVVSPSGAVRHPSGYGC
ncbi:hypothetical protein WDZ17_06485 [Pseudokineococcus basanitobsidens]|uniref:Uncharacterized protein n=1 Tax=Pseudokineococcus basanitobsidens TaxID=1926649 RepID=A0ABU8RIX2_9ACTN